MTRSFSSIADAATWLAPAVTDTTIDAAQLARTITTWAEGRLVVAAGWDADEDDYDANRWVALVTAADLAGMVRDAEATAETLRQDRDDQIRAALAAGVTATELAGATGLSLPRLYQIKDSRR